MGRIGHEATSRQAHLRRPRRPHEALNGIAWPRTGLTGGQTAPATIPLCANFYTHTVFAQILRPSPRSTTPGNRLQSEYLFTCRRQSGLGVTLARLVLKAPRSAAAG